MKASDNRFTLLSDLEMIRKFADVDRFDLDPCADRKSPTSQRILHMFTPEIDGLKQDWFGHIFVNPPFSNISPWIEKALDEKSRRNVQTITLLLPANRTEQPWWGQLWMAFNHDRAMYKRSPLIRWVSPRMKFGTPEDPHGTRKKNHPPFACVLFKFWSVP